MIVVLPCCAKDEHLALLNLELARRMDRPVRNTCVIPIEYGFDAKTVTESARNFFMDVQTFTFPAYRGNPEWPRPQNWCWQQTVRYLQNQQQAWFWWEPDCVPLKPGWISTLEAEYVKAKRPFMGHWIEGRSDWPNGYMVGIGVYPHNLADYNHTSLFVTNIAWDMNLGPSIASQCHRINHLIDHRIEPVVFTEADERDHILDTAVLFHKCKDGSLPLILLGRRQVQHRYKEVQHPEDQPAVEVRQSPLTVVITNFKRPEHVWNAFQSCLKAGVTNIVVSASGVDDTLQAVHDRMRQHKSDVIIDSIPGDRGCNEMWLRGVMRVKTPWVNILHDDDELLPAFCKIEPLLGQDQGFFHFAANRHGIAGTEANGTLRTLPMMQSGPVKTDFLYPTLVSGTLSLSPVSGVFHVEHIRAVLEECQQIENEFLLRPGFMVGNDLLIWLRAIEKQYVFYWINEPLIAYGCWPGSCTHDDIHNNRGQLTPIYNRMRQYWIKHPTLRASNKEPPRPVFEAINGAHKIPGRIIHALERHTYGTTEARLRIQTAIKSWEYLYNRGEMVPMHYTSYRRTSADVGDDRALPFWKDVVAYALTAANLQDIIVFTNDDTILHPDTPLIVRRELQRHQAVVSHRCEYNAQTPPMLGMGAPLFRSMSIKSIGRDLFAFRVQWLIDHWHEIPDFLLAAPAWDIVLAGLIRTTQGATGIQKGKWDQCWEFEIPSGYVAHIWHDPVWNTQKCQRESKANAYNLMLAKQAMTRFYLGHAWGELWAL